MIRARAVRTFGGCLAAAFPIAPLLAAAPSGLGGGEELNISLGRIVTALLICILLAGFAVLLIRQRSGKTDLRALFARIELRPRSLRVVETRRLSAHADICLLRHDGTEYLLLLMAGDCRILREREGPGDSAGEAVTPCS